LVTKEKEEGEGECEDEVEVKAVKEKTVAEFNPEGCRTLRSMFKASLFTNPTHNCSELI
jgi:hypothetical protein